MMIFRLMVGGGDPKPPPSESYGLVQIMESLNLIQKLESLQIMIVLMDFKVMNLIHIPILKVIMGICTLVVQMV